MELLTNEQMQNADRLTIESGVPSFELMQSAAKAVAEHIGSKFETDCSVLIVCGPGNNGGDGYVIGKLLLEKGFPVSVWSPFPLDRLQGDAAKALEYWGDEVSVGAPPTEITDDVVVDALFGSGLQRPLEGLVEQWAATINQAAATETTHVVSVDVPSGLNGNTGTFDGSSVNADSTVTFFRKKPAHLLLPGRSICGEVILADIGIKPSVLDKIPVRVFENDPSIWLNHFPQNQIGQHKYDRGHAIAFSGPAHATGAARLSATSALRIGAGLVTLASPPESVATNAAHMTAVMIKPISQRSEVDVLLSDQRVTSAVIGPANGIGDNTRVNVLAALQSNTSAVLDADALTSFERLAEQLFSAIQSSKKPVVITPHDGEFGRLFKTEFSAIDRLSRAREASKISGAVVVLKGADTVIASPDGRAAINANAPATLATAGSGDVLAGFIGGLLAQRMPPFEAACAAVWIHGQCANAFGHGLIAEDLATMVPAVLSDLLD